METEPGEIEEHSNLAIGDPDVRTRGKDGYRFVSDGVRTDGGRQHTTGMFQFDGKDYPVEGARRAGATSTASRKGSNTVEIVQKRDGKVVGHITESVCRWTAKRSPGRAIRWCSSTTGSDAAAR